MSEVSSSNNSTSTPVAAPPDADLEWRGGDVLLQALAAGTLAQAGARLSTSVRSDVWLDRAVGRNSCSFGSHSRSLGDERNSGACHRWHLARA